MIKEFLPNKLADRQEFLSPLISIYNSQLLVFSNLFPSVKICG